MLVSVTSPVLVAVIRNSTVPPTVTGPVTMVFSPRIAAVVGMVSRVGSS